MTCQELIDFLMDYLDEELAAEQRQVFEEHLRECPECVTYVETYRLTIHVTRLACEASEGPCEKPPDRLVQAILAACRKEGGTA